MITLKQWGFDCNEWLGPSTSGGIAGALSREYDCKGDWGAKSEEQHAAAGSLRLAMAAFCAPHPDKVKAGVRGTIGRTFGTAGEDAYVLVHPDGADEDSSPSSMQLIGVADGVWEWSQFGIDAGECSRSLMRESAAAAVGAIGALASNPAPAAVSPSSSSAFDAMKVAELKQELSERGLPASGKKAELIARLKAATATTDGAGDGDGGSSSSSSSNRAQDALEIAWKKVRAADIQGSTTTLVASFDVEKAALDIANIGDPSSSKHGR
jgi:hypothetical protein